MRLISHLLDTEPHMLETAMNPEVELILQLHSEKTQIWMYLDSLMPGLDTSITYLQAYFRRLLNTCIQNS